MNAPITTSINKNRGIATFIALAVLPLSGFATDIYIPAMPAMQNALGVSSLQIQYTITFFLISYGLAQLFIGAVIDSFGRYWLGLTALVVFAIASLVIATTHSITIIYAMRIIHGISIATVVVSKRAYFVDVYEGAQLKNYLSIFTIIWSVGPIVAPFVGGFLQTKFGYAWNFYFMSVAALILVVCEFAYGAETIKIRAPFNVAHIAQTYAHMISTARFTLGLFINACAYGMVMVYNMTGAFIIEHQYHFSAIVIGYCSLILGCAWTAGGFISKATIEKPFFSKLMVNMLFQLAVGVAMIATIPLVDNIYTLVTFAFIIHSCGGYTFNNYFAYNMAQFPQHAGIAGGLIGGGAYIIISILTYGVVHALPAQGQFNLGSSYVILTLLSLLAMLLVYKLNKKSTSPVRHIVATQQTTH